MDQLWAPWRSNYVREAPEVDTAESSCFLCRGLAASDDRSNLLAWRRPHSAVFLNKFPYNAGHLLIVPRTHEGRIANLTGRALYEPLETIQLVVTLLEPMLRPHGFNIGLNLGKSAGAGVPGHLHWHVVPRWDGDTNFMPVLADTKVIVESLYEFYDSFTRAVAALEG